MPTISHWHDFTSVTGGWQCQIPPCNMIITNAQLQANQSVTIGTKSPGVDMRAILNHAAKKAGLS
jgi:hypothetical protein